MNFIERPGTLLQEIRAMRPNQLCDVYDELYGLWKETTDTADFELADEISHHATLISNELWNRINKHKSGQPLIPLPKYWEEDWGKAA